MDIAYVLFSPKGRIGPRDFLRGLILLTGASIIVQVAATFLSPTFNFVQPFLAWAYVCVIGKRLHDAGLTAWLVLVIWLVSVVVGSVVINLLIPVLAPKAYETITQIQGIAISGDFEGMMKALEVHGPEVERQSALPKLISLLVNAGLFALIGGKLKSDPNPNTHGPATGPGKLS
ncbi:MAG: hypothetical protein R3C13_02475 [Hyphomonas sp.]|uniref:hypothetical protein n=1 Tax=Hyphomonas sp. TaxID=87 RepID=UPI0035295A93